MIIGLANGGTKEGEYNRTIQMLKEKTGKTKEEVMHILYFLHDSQYGNNELREMADIIHEELKKGIKN